MIRRTVYNSQFFEPQVYYCYNIPEETTTTSNRSLRLIKNKRYYVVRVNDSMENPGRYYYKEIPFTNNDFSLIESEQYNGMYIIGKIFPKYFCEQREFRNDLIDSILK